MKEPKILKNAASPLLDRFVREGIKFNCHLDMDCELNPERDMVVRFVKCECWNSNNTITFSYAFVDEETGDSFNFTANNVKWNALYNGFTLNRYNGGIERSATLKIA